MEMYRGSGGIAPPFLTSAQDGSEVLTAVTTKSIIFWDMMSCSPV
jgi:hypothetical protein